MHIATVLLRFGLVALVLAALPTAASAGSKDPDYQTAFNRWLGDSLATFTGPGVSFHADRLVFDHQGATFVQTDPSGLYNGGPYWLGEATGPELSTSFAFTEAIASWNASTPPGTWIEVRMRARLEGTWTKWYSMGVWASGTEAVNRHSVRLQGDSDGYVAVDTLVLTAKKVVADSLQLQARLFSVDGTAVPSISRLGVSYNTTVPKKFVVSRGNGALWNTLLDVPTCSQMVYPDGGNVWCSPTSTSMVLGFWDQPLSSPCEPRVRDAVNGVYDYVYNGHGNWPFNTAYAATKAMEAYVLRFTGLDAIEPWVAAGVPVVVSYAWRKGELTNAPISASSGHLGVVVGFDSHGNPIVNDPAAPSDGEVQRTYLRAEFESLWLTSSGGAVYLIFPPGMQLPGF